MKSTFTSYRQLLLLALPFLFFVSTYGLLFYLYRPRTLPCPHLIGKDCFTALKELSSCNLYAKIIHIRNDEQHPHGTISAQIPQPYQLIKEQQTLYITVCQQPEPAACPRLIGLRGAHVATHAQQHGYECDMHHITYNNAPQQSCFAQWPTEHDRPTDTMITVYCAQHEPALFVWPELIGLELEQAQAILATYGIQATIHGKQHPHRPAYVIGQMPGSGSIINLDHHDIRVELSISFKPPAGR